MATTVTFDDGAGGDITIEAPAYPGKEPARRPQLVGRNYGGGIQVTDISAGTDWDEQELYWDFLPQTEYDDLKTFITSTVNWSETSFTYTDHDGVDHTNMHYMGGLESFREVAFEVWAGTLKISKDMSA